LLKWAVSQEILNTTSSATLFRGSSIATKLLYFHFFDRTGIEYLKKTVLRTILTGVTSCNYCLEVDPSKIEQPSDVNTEENLKKVLSISQSFLDTIFGSIDDFPLSFRRLLRHAQDEVTKRFPEMRRLVVGGFTFLRFFCPAIVTPQRFGLMTEQPSRDNQRGLVLISKLLQNLANDVEYDGQKENYSNMNDFIKANRAGLINWFDKLTSVDTDTEPLNGATPLNSELEVQAIQNILGYLENKGEIIIGLLSPQH